MEEQKPIVDLFDENELKFVFSSSIYNEKTQ